MMLDLMLTNAWKYSAATPAPPSGGGDGADVVAAAVKKEGLPYVWGGGGCSGESGGGFDCLTQYAICQAVDKTIPRTTQLQYHSSMGTHMPRAEAKPGDMIFWADGGDCASKVSHVGIFMRDGWMVNAAHKGTPVREQAIWTSSDGTSICPDAVRPKGINMFLLARAMHADCINLLSLPFVRKPSFGQSKDLDL
ncbi:MAG: hypothetical protein LQ337_006505 [Flavoplaca oasis]|nr:MAG: hypothetical protein LQ337_006505 [Flavoplaca oasis]